LCSTTAGPTTIGVSGVHCCAIARIQSAEPAQLAGSVRTTSLCAALRPACRADHGADEEGSSTSIRRTCSGDPGSEGISVEAVHTRMTSCWFVRISASRSDSRAVWTRPERASRTMEIVGLSGTSDGEVWRRATTYRTEAVPNKRA